MMVVTVLLALDNSSRLACKLTPVCSFVFMATG